MARFEVKKLKHIAVMTSGGDAPGMNAALRAVVRTGIYHGLKVTAIMHGFEGLFKKEYQEMGLNSVANIIQRGGTIIKTGRCLEFYNANGRSKAAKNFKQAGFDAM